jgi:hypothetical protein
MILDIAPGAFHRLFRSGRACAHLWARFMLAQRLLRGCGIHPPSIPEIAHPDGHPLWLQFEVSARDIGAQDGLLAVSEMYCHHLLRTPAAPRYVRALIAALLGTAGLNPVILPRVAAYMRRSPANCRAMAEVLAVDVDLGGYAAARDRGAAYFRDWCTAYSGLLLAAPKAAGAAAFPWADDLRGPISGDDALVRALLFSIHVACTDAKKKQSFCLSRETLDPWFPILFHPSTPPLIRQWAAISVHATIAKHEPEPETQGQSGLHIYAALLMADSARYTRATGVAILLWLLTQDHPEFNETLLSLAIPAAIDGSEIVRVTFAHFLAKYLSFRGLADDDGDVEWSELVRGPMESPKRTPRVRGLLRLLTCDPSQKVRSVVDRIVGGSADRWKVTDIHRMAHCALFSSGQQGKAPVRYSSQLFSVGELANLETIRVPNCGRITAIIFDPEHGNMCFGTENGFVVWGNNRWNLGEAVIAIAFLGLDRVVALSRLGCVFLLLDGADRCVECFRSGIDQTEAAGMTRVRNSARICVAQGARANVWDMERLQLVESVPLGGRAAQIITAGSRIYCSLATGQIVVIDPSGQDPPVQLAAHEGLAIARLGEDGGRLSDSLEDGRTFVWDGDRPIHKSNRDPSITLVVHPRFPLVLSFTTTTVAQIIRDGRSSINLGCGAAPSCGCWDEEYPLCAVGYSDGSVAVWRVVV